MQLDSVILGYPVWQLGLAATAVAVVLVLIGIGIGRWVADTDDDDGPELAEFRDDDGELPDEVDLEPPTIRKSRWGIIGAVWKTYRYLRKSEKLAGKGYVKWYHVDDTWPKPRYVKPEDKGAGVREYETSDGVYLFPDKARKPSAHDGIWTYVHQAGDPEPVNVIDYRETVMTSKQADEWLTQGVTAERPSSGFIEWLVDLSPQQMMMGGIAIAVILAVIFGQGGGI